MLIRTVTEILPQPFLIYRNIAHEARAVLYRLAVFTSACSIRGEEGVYLVAGACLFHAVETGFSGPFRGFRPDVYIAEYFIMGHGARHGDQGKGNSSS